MNKGYSNIQIGDNNTNKQVDQSEGKPPRLKQAVIIAAITGFIGLVYAIIKWMITG